MSGLHRRLARLFRHADGRAILMPIDHGLWYGPVAGIESPETVTRLLIPASDGLLVAPGFARAISHILPSDRALALRIGAATALSPVQDYEAIFAGIETALRLDADALVHTIYLGSPHDGRAIRDLGQVVETANRYDVPVVAELLPSADTWTAEQVAHWARVGFEVGASVIKTVYTGDSTSFVQVVRGCPLPILIAGGPAVTGLEDLARTVSGAVEAGAAGLAIGRRIWQTLHPGSVIGILSRLVHGEISVDTAIADLANVEV
jgi:DhnA family fructose-bisphosphate aldolase class Ia